jgi:cytochrome oxidase Cu insertion factor (SCO1/SenC/PrrC family)
MGYVVVVVIFVVVVILLLLLLLLLLLFGKNTVEHKNAPKFSEGVGL